jgi:hypothetical protein
VTQISRSRIVRNGSMPQLRDTAEESAQPMLDRKRPFNFRPSDTLEKTMKRLFGQILEAH